MSIIEPYVDLFFELYELFARENPDYEMNFSVKDKLDLDTEWKVLLSGNLNDKNGINTDIFVELSYDSDENDYLEIKYLRPCSLGRLKSESLNKLLKISTRLKTEIVNENRVAIMQSMFIKLNRRAETIDDYINDSEIVKGFKAQTMSFMLLAVDFTSDFLKQLLFYGVKYSKKFRDMYSD